MAQDAQARAEDHDKDQHKHFRAMKMHERSAEIHDAIAEDDLVVLRWSLTGTHREQFLGIPPTGKAVTLRGIDIYRVQDGKIAEHWDTLEAIPPRSEWKNSNGKF